MRRVLHQAFPATGTIRQLRPSDHARFQEHLLRLETSLGGRETMLDWMEGLNSAQDITLSRNRADIRDADLIQLSSDLKMAETTYQASLMVSSKLMQMSLFDFL